MPRRRQSGQDTYWDGHNLTVTAFDKLPPDQKASIKSLTVREFTDKQGNKMRTIVVKMHDALRALAALNKMTGFYDEGKGGTVFRLVLRMPITLTEGGLREAEEARENSRRLTSGSGCATALPVARLPRLLEW